MKGRYNYLKTNKIANSTLKQLCPFIDANGLVRVGWRLDTTSIPIPHKNQIFMPRKSWLTHFIRKTVMQGKD